MALAGSTLKVALAVTLAIAVLAQRQAQALPGAVGPAGGSSSSSSGSSSSSSSSSSGSASSGSSSSSGSASSGSASSSGSSASSGSASSSGSSSSSSGSGSAAGGSTGSAAGAGGYHQQISGASTVVASDAKPATRAVETAIDACRDNFVGERQCIADALDSYAEALRELPLPPDLRGLPAIVSRAAHRVRAARTKAEATTAIRIAIAEVHKTIALLKADDAGALKAETRDGSFVAETLMVADNRLERAVGL
jgi:hypothetical protein